MKRNMSKLDGVIRITVAMIIAFIGYFEILPLAWIIGLGILAAIFLFTGVSGFCPIYKAFGMSTRKTEQES